MSGDLDFFRIIIGMVMLVMFIHPKATREFRIRFWIGVAVLVAIAAIGLRPWLAHRALDNWASYGSLFQAIFNIAVTVLLVTRYFVYGRSPRVSF